MIAFPRALAAMREQDRIGTLLDAECGHDAERLMVDYLAAGRAIVEAFADDTAGYNRRETVRGLTVAIVREMVGGAS